MAERLGDGVILMRSGGNFGDLYALYHELRLRMIEDFPDNKVVMLPQQAMFLSNAYLDRTRTLMARHRDITLIARDVVTLHLMVQHFGDHAQVLMAPDMAFALGPSHPGLRAILRYRVARPDRPRKGLRKPARGGGGAERKAVLDDQAGWVLRWPGDQLSRQAPRRRGDDHRLVSDAPVGPDRGRPGPARL